jgi:hypothetical protein
VALFHGHCTEMTKYDHLFLSGLSDIVVNAWGGQLKTIGKSAFEAEK